MYLLDMKSRVTLRKRLIKKRITIFAIGGVIFIAAGRLLRVEPTLIAIGLTFFVTFAAVVIPSSVSKKLGRFMALRYELTASHVRVWSDGQTDSSQTINWSDLVEFAIELKQGQSYVLLATEKNDRLQIWEADLFISDSDEVMLPVAAALYVGKAGCPPEHDHVRI